MAESAAQSYRYINDIVSAIQLTLTTEAECMSIFMNLLDQNLLADFTAKVIDITQPLTFIFRYKDETILQTLYSGDYLVKNSSGRYEAWAKNNFTSKYVLSTTISGVYADIATLNE